MVFSPSPALRRIRQLLRLIRKHPDLPAKTRNSPWRSLQRPGPELPGPELPDPEQFMDSSAGRDAISDRTDIDPRQRHVSCSGRIARRIER
jgi:hypothetical protein